MATHTSILETEGGTPEPALTLSVLGTPELRRGGALVRFRSRKELALLVYLAVAEAPQSREKLIALLWPDSNRRLGQAALRNSLVRLRRALGEAAGLVLADSSTVALHDLRALDLDLRLIEEALRTPADDARATASLEAAVSACRGEFLEGFSLPDTPELDDWMTRQREGWHQQLERVFSRLSRLYFEMGRADAAITVTQRWIEHSPLDETAYRRLMQLHFLTGNRSAALQAFERCARVLKDQLDVAPEAETVALAERMRNEIPLPHVPKTDGAPSRLPELPFVGRDLEHAALVTASMEATAGRPRAVVLLGEAGIGKTRLAHAFLAWAGVQQGDILAGRTFEAGARLPYGPLVAALRERVEREIAPADLLPDVWLTELSRLLPELRDRYPDLPPPVAGDPNLDRSHLVEAIAQLLHALSRRKPLILWIDDLQWADTTTLEVLPQLCRRWTETGSRILLLASLRREALDPGTRWREWLVQVEREIDLTRMELGSLSVEATRELLFRLSDPSAEGQEASARFGEWLFTETAGQPHFMAETVKMLIERRVLAAHRDPGNRWVIDFRPALSGAHRRLPVPPGVREVIVTRLGALSPPARALLMAAAVLGSAGSFEHLCRVSGVDELNGLTALDELLAALLLREGRGTDRPYTFGHDKVRDVVYAEAGEARRRAFHQRAFAALETTGGPAAELAHHALLASLTEPAFQYSVAAGEAASAVYAHAEAEQHFRRALDLATDGRVQVSPERRTKLSLRLGRTLELMSRYDDALAVYDEMERQARARADRQAELAGMVARMMPLSTVTAMFDPAGAERLADQALDLARALGDGAAEAGILWNQLNIYRNTNRLPRAVACGEQALELTRRLDLQERLPFILHDLGYCAAFMAEFGQASARFGEAAHLWKAANNLPMLADGLIGLCMVHMVSGEYDGAIAAFEEALGVAERIGSEWTLAGCRHNIGFVFADRGDVARAILEMETGIDLSAKVGFVSAQVVAMSDLASLHGSLGSRARGLELAQEAAGICRARIPALQVYPLSVLAQLSLAAGATVEAEAAVELMRSCPDRHALKVFQAMAPLAEAELALAERGHTHARALAVEAEDLARATGARRFLPTALDLQARAWLGLGETREATARWQAARVEAERLQARTRLWPILLALARLEEDPTAAAALWEEAQVVAIHILDHTPPDLQAPFLALFEEHAATSAGR